VKLTKCARAGNRVGLFSCVVQPPEGSQNTITTQRRRALDQLIEKQRVRSLGGSRRDNDATAPRLSIVIDERVRLEFSTNPRSVSVSPPQVAAGRTPKQEPLMLQVEVW
jgi:hypothetical protein